MNLPAQYAWLADEPGPKMLLEGLRLYGIDEAVDNRTIMGWAKELGIPTTEFSSATAVPWCGLFMAIVAKRATWEPVKDPLWARNWAKFGNPVVGDMAELGDVLVFERNGGGHVGMYVGEDDLCYHVLGGNQADSVRVSRIQKGRRIATRRAPWRVAQPANVRVIRLAPTGRPSTNEA